MVYSGRLLHPRTNADICLSALATGPQTVAGRNLSSATIYVPATLSEKWTTVGARS